MSVNGEHRLSLHPFRGLRYAPERVGAVARVTSPPYDVVVRPEGQRELERAHPRNIVRLILPRDPDPDVRHRGAADTLRRWRSEGVLVADPAPALYVYQQRHGELLQRGLIGALRLPPPESRVVLPHEDVMAEVVEDRAALMRATRTNLEPLLLSYQGTSLTGGHPDDTAEVIARTVRRPPILATTTEDGFAHRLWRVTDPTALETVTRDLAARQALIADGHHRWATYLRLRSEHGTAPGPWAYGLVLLVDSSRYPLQVSAIHRVLRERPLPGLLADLRGSFRQRPINGPLPEALEVLAATPGHAFLLAGEGGFHLVDRPDPGLLDRTVRHDRPASWRELDATVLHSALLDDLWSVPDRPDQISYVHDAAAAVAKAERLGGTAVLLRPVREEVVRELAEQGVTMPRKSTSFGPKPATGLVLRALDLD